MVAPTKLLANSENLFNNSLQIFSSVLTQPIKGGFERKLTDERRDIIIKKVL